MTNLIDVQIKDGLAVVTLQDERRRNAVSLALAEQLVSACEDIDANVDIGAVVLRGAGGFFSSGGDRGELAEICADPTSSRSIAMTSAIYESFLRVGALKPPVVAAIRGGALGAGINLALSADVRVVARDAVIASGFTRLGVHPGGGHYGLLGRAVGPEATTVLGVLGHTVDGARAVELGLAWEFCEDADVDARAEALTVHAAADPALARSAKTSMRAQLGPPAIPTQAGVELERAPQLWSFARKGREGWSARERPTARPEPDSIPTRP